MRGSRFEEYWLFRLTLAISISDECSVEVLTIYVQAIKLANYVFTYMYHSITSYLLIFLSINCSLSQ